MFAATFIMIQSKVVPMLEFLHGELGFKNEIPDSNGQTPLFYAAKFGHETVIETLITTCGHNPNLIDTLKSQTAIFYAASNGKDEAISKLVSLDADINH